MQYEKAKENIIHLLETGLASNLFYHGLHHTYDVLHVTGELCDSEGVDEYHKKLLQTAALLHDSGFTIGNPNHEEKGCNIARKILPGYGYTDGEIDRICGMIMATKIPQSPKDKYEEILCDADLDYLGRDDFYVIGQTLFDELRSFQIMDDEKEWNRVQIKFLEGHTYFTTTNQKRRQPQKQVFLNQIKRLVSTY